MKLKKVLTLASLAAASALVLAACGSKSEEKSSKEEVVFATAGTTAPFSFEKDGNLTGYDIEVAKAVFKDSDKYEVKFQKTEWSSIFTGLDSGKYQLAGNNISYSDERGEKYLYSAAIGATPSVLAVQKDSKIEKYEDESFPLLNRPFSKASKISLSSDYRCYLLIFKQYHLRCQQYVTSYRR